MENVFTVIIPARYNSQRLPGKALIKLAGKPMIQHVFERVSESDAAAVVVATDDERIAEVVKAFGGTVCMTSGVHPSGTDRVHEAAQTLGLAPDDVVVNVQGDEPLIPAVVIEQVAANLIRTGVPVASLYETMMEMDEVLDPGNVKVVTDENDNALYFSRSPIPYDRDQQNDPGKVSYKRHLGIYAYRLSFLNDFVSWPQCVLESVEKLEQLRALSHGIKIHVAKASVSIPAGVDTPEDLERTRRIMEAR
ncbi:MAG: 3-deoxy-manno-octulosonate cytidylyltransferase [Pseudomonadales bacterium]